MYLIQVNYRNDNERKRLDYLVDKRRGEVEVLRGYMFTVKDSAYKEVMEEVLNKFPSELVKSYKLESVDLKEEKRMEDFSVQVNKDLREVRSFLSYLLSKRRGVLEGNVGDVEVYDIYTRKGIVRLHLSLVDGRPVTVNFHLEGAEEAVKKLGEEFREEMRFFNSSG
jgi:hypothetical protein